LFDFFSHEFNSHLAKCLSWTKPILLKQERIIFKEDAGVVTGIFAERG